MKKIKAILWGKDISEQVVQREFPINYTEFLMLCLSCVERHGGYGANHVWVIYTDNTYMKLV